MRRGALVVASVAAACAPATTWRAQSPDPLLHVTATERSGGVCVRAAGRFEHCDDSVNLAAMAFSESGGSVAYAARSGEGWRIVHDGRAGAPWAGVGAPVLSTDGARLAYAATDGVRWRVVADGRAGPEFDAILEGSIMFDPSGRRVAYAARRGDSTFAVVDGLSQGAWSGIGRITFSEDGAHVAYAASRDGRAVVVRDGEVGRPHDAIGELAFPGAGGALAYAARDSGAWAVHHDGRRLGDYDDVRGLTFRSVGALAIPAFVARSGSREAVVVAGAAPHRWRGRITSLAVAPRGPRWGYVADGTTVFLDGDSLATEIAAAELVTSRDGSRWAYLAEDTLGTSVVHDGGRTPFDLVVEGTLQFLPDTAVWACLAGDRSRRELFVVVDGRRTRRRLDWSEVVRFTRQRGRSAETSLRAWVAAEARTAMREAAGR